MGRPRKGEEKDRPRHIGFRAATWVHDAVMRLSAEQGIPASEVAHDLMEIALSRLGFKAPKEPSAERRAFAGRTKNPSEIASRGSLKIAGWRRGFDPYR